MATAIDRNIKQNQFISQQAQNNNFYQIAVSTIVMQRSHQ